MDKKVQADLIAKAEETLSRQPNVPAGSLGNLLGAEIDPTLAFDELFKKPKTIKDKQGKEHPVPESDFDKDWDFYHGIKLLIKDAGSQNWDTLLGDLFELKDGKERVLDIASLMLGKDKAFVRSNFNFNGLVGQMYRFFVTMMTLGKHQKDQLAKPDPSEALSNG